jgi:hypothetical protein
MPKITISVQTESNELYRNYEVESPEDVEALKDGVGEMVETLLDKEEL